MEYHDDDTIHDETLLLRRVPSRHNIYIIWDDNRKRWRPSSASFEDHPDGSPMSVVLADTLAELERPLTSALEGHERGFALASITAGLARANDQVVVRDPLPEEPAHGLVVGQKTKKRCRELAKSADWIVPPDLP